MRTEREKQEAREQAARRAARAKLARPKVTHALVRGEMLDKQGQQTDKRSEARVIVSGARQCRIVVYVMVACRSFRRQWAQAQRTYNLTSVKPVQTVWDTRDETGSIACEVIATRDDMLALVDAIDAGKIPCVCDYHATVSVRLPGIVPQKKAYAEAKKDGVRISREYNVKHFKPKPKPQLPKPGKQSETQYESLQHARECAAHTKKPELKNLPCPSGLDREPIEAPTMDRDADILRALAYGSTITEYQI